MDPRNAIDFVEKKRRNKSKKTKLRNKRKIYKCAINFGPCLCNVLKKEHPKLSLSIKSINILNSFGNDMLNRIAAEASCVAKCNKHKTIKSTEIQSAVRLVLPPGLAREAINFGIRAVIKYNQSKKVGSRNSVEMTEVSPRREKWLKCYSKDKKMIYYWNSETKESYWEEDSHELLKKPNVEIDDKSEEMRNGKVPIFHTNTETVDRPEKGITTKSQLHITSASKSECEDEDDKDFNDTLNAYYETSRSSSSIFNGSQGSFSKYELRTDFERRYSEPLLKSNVTENAVDRRKSMEIPPVKAQSPMTCARPVAKPFTNGGKRSLSDTSSSSTSSQRPGLAKNESVSQPKLAKSELQKPPPRGRHKTPIQDRKMKEKEELLRKQKQKNSGSGAHNLPDIIADSRRAPMPGESVNGDNKMQSLMNFVIPKRKECNSTSDRESGRGSQADSQHSSPRQQISTPPTPPGVPQVPYRNRQVPNRSRRVPPQPMQVTETMTSDSPNISQPVRKSNNSWVHKVWKTPPAVLAEAVGVPMPAPAPVQLHRRPPLLPTPPSSEIVLEPVTTHFKDPFSNSQHQNFRRTVRTRNPAEEIPATKLDSNRVQESVPTQFKDSSPNVQQNFRRTVRCRNSAEEITTPKLDSNRVQEPVTTQFKDPFSNSQHQNFRRTVRARKPAEEIPATKLDSDRVQESVPTQFKDSSPNVQQNFRRTVRCRNSAEEITTPKLDSNRVQEPVTTQFKDPFSNSQHQNFRRTVRARKPAEEIPATKLDSDRAQETITSGQFKGPSPILTRTVRDRNSGEESNKKQSDTGRVQEPNMGQFKDPSQILIKRTGRSGDSAEESNESKFALDRDSPCVGNGIRKRIDDSDDSDSDGSETANFKRTRTSKETPSESTFAISTPSTRFTLDATGRSSTTVGRQSSAATGLSSAATRPTTALGSAPFDARQILERRRSMQRETKPNKPSCSNQDDSAMEWEGIEPAQESHNNNIKERVGQPSTSMIMCSLKFKPLIIVCDTNALIHYIDLVEELIDGTLLGIPVTVVVPYQVFRELDGMKEHPNQEVMGGARAAIRLINGIIHSGCPSQDNFVLQNCTMHKKKAKHDLELQKNDDFILNCALQESQACGDDKIVILLTGDKHLQIHAKMVDIISKCPTTLKGWARDYKEKVRLQALGVRAASPQSHCANSLSRQSDNLLPTETKMDVDPDPLLASSSIVSSASSSCTQTEKSVTFNNCIKFYADSLTDNLFQLLKCVIDKCNEREYGDLKRHASQPRQSWTLVHCLGDVVRRWAIITEKRLSPDMNSNIKQIIELVKKYNKGKEEFTNNDMKTYFMCSETLAGEFVELYKDVSGFFLTRLNELFEEWEQKTLSQSVSLCEEDDPQPADVALQNIYNCMRSDYETWKEKTEREKNGDRKKELEVRLRAFHMKVTNMLRVIRGALEDYPQSSLTVDDECIFNFHKMTTIFVAEDGNVLAFELTRENILALFKENNLRKGVQAMLVKFRRLQCDVMDLLEDLSSSDSDDDFD